MVDTDIEEGEPREPQAAAMNAEQGALSALLGRLVALQEASHELAGRQPQQAGPPSAGQCKPPTFDGKGDIEVYLTQFAELADYCRWEGVLRLFKLREGLQDEAADCVASARTYEEARKSLLDQFCEKPATARERLVNLKREKGTSLRVFAREVKRLTDRGHGEVAEAVRGRYALEAFSRGAGHAGLRRHLQAVQPRTLEEAVTASEVYFELGDPVVATREVDLPPPEVGGALAAAATSATSQRSTEDIRQAELEKREDTLSGLERRLETLLGVVERLVARETATPQRTPLLDTPRRGKIRCYGCQQEGHIRRDCPREKQKRASNE